MKKLALATALISAMAAPAFAGGFGDAIQEPGPIVVVPGPSSSLPGWVIPAAIVAALIAVAASSDS